MPTLFGRVKFKHEYRKFGDPDLQKIVEHEIKERLTVSKDSVKNIAAFIALNFKPTQGIMKIVKFKKIARMS